MKKRFLCLWLPNWPIQRLVAGHPPLSGQPAAVYKTHPQRGQLVVTCSTAARQQGLQPDMPLSEAKALAGNREKPLQIFEHDPLQDRTTLESLAISCEVFSPHVGIETAEEPSSIFVEVTSVSHLFGDEYQLAVKAQKHCWQHGYLALAAVADTVGQAWAVSHFGQPITWSPHDDPLETMRPMVIEPDRPDVISNLPPEALRLLPATTATLRELGICRIHQLAQLSRTELTTRFGNEIIDQLDKASGRREETFVGCQMPPEFQATECFDYPTDHRGSIEAVLARLVQRLCGDMYRRGRGGLQWKFQFVCDDRSIDEFQVGLFSPTAFPGDVIPLIQMQLDNKTFLGMVHEVSVSVMSSALMEEKQNELFTAKARTHKSSLNHLINRLSSRLGNANVVTPRLTSSKLPESAFFHSQLVGTTLAARKPVSSKMDPLDRPLRLYQSPLLLSAVSATGQGSPLAMFRWHGRPCHVAHAWGPERIETRWWKGPTVRRDYFRIEIQSGQQLWVYRDLENRKWFLHGEFD